MKWPRFGIIRRWSDALLASLERLTASIAPRASKVLRVFVFIAAVKLGILVFLGLDLMLPSPPVRQAAAPGWNVTGPTVALAQQTPPPSNAAAPTPPAAAPSPTAEGLLKRKAALDQREQTLKTLEADLNARMAKLKQMETNLRTMLDEAKGIKDKKLKHLINVYSNMNAKKAAQVLETLDNNIAVKILAGMRGRQAGEVLNNMSAKKAAGLTEMLTRLQLPEEPPAGAANQ